MLSREESNAMQIASDQAQQDSDIAQEASNLDQLQPAHITMLRSAVEKIASHSKGLK